MPANWITLARLPLLFCSLALLYRAPPPWQVAAAGLLFVGILLDTVDGVVARRTGTTSVLGSVLDIAADRTYELALWACLAELRLVPVALPVVIVARTALTDALRSVGVGRGTAPLEQPQGAVGRFLVQSTAMRTGYALAKITTFCGFALVHAFTGFPDGSGWPAVAAAMTPPLDAMAWVTAILCVVRGAPVIAAVFASGTRPRTQPSRFR